MVKVFAGNLRDSGDPDGVSRDSAGCKSVNDRMAELHRKYGGEITVEYFGDGTWRVWLRDWHHHWSAGCQGGLSGQGATIKQALDRIDAAVAKKAPFRGFHCRPPCPDYSDDVY